MSTKKPARKAKKLVLKLGDNPLGDYGRKLALSGENALADYTAKLKHKLQPKKKK